MTEVQQAFDIKTDINVDNVFDDIKDDIKYDINNTSNYGSKGSNKDDIKDDNISGLTSIESVPHNNIHNISTIRYGVWGDGQHTKTFDPQLFVDKSYELYKCIKCGIVPYQPITCQNGHSFCAKCGGNETKICPQINCNTELSLDGNKMVRIGILKIHCPHRNRNCPWIGTVNAHWYHMDTCTYNPINIDKINELKNQREKAYHDSNTWDKDAWNNDDDITDVWRNTQERTFDGLNIDFLTEMILNQQNIDTINDPISNEFINEINQQDNQ